MEEKRNIQLEQANKRLAELTSFDSYLSYNRSKLLVRMELRFEDGRFEESKGYAKLQRVDKFALVGISGCFREFISSEISKLELEIARLKGQN